MVRSLAGLGTAIALPASFGIVGTTFKDELGRTMAFAAMALGYPVGAGPGQIVGALLADNGGCVLLHAGVWSESRGEADPVAGEDGNTVSRFWAEQPSYPS